MSSKEGEANEQLAKIFDLIASNPNNNRCADCDVPNPEWTSQGYGTFICLKCAGYHRSMGAHITTVRSLTLDEWSPEQFVVLERGGNDRFWEYLKNCRCIQRYHLPEVLYYTEVLKARVQDREPIEYKEEEWSGLVKQAEVTTAEPVIVGAGSQSPIPSGSGGFTSSAKSVKSNPVAWMNDSAVKACSICNVAFTLINRKHHCRRCGKVVCSDCAPANNTRPIMEWGMKEPVRHCKQCYRSPSVQWKN